MALSTKMLSELRKAVDWAKEETGNDVSDYLWSVAEEAADEADQMEDWAGEPAYPTNDDKFEHVQELVWGEAEKYVDFVRERGE